MKKLKDIINLLSPLQIVGNTDVMIHDVAIDSRKVRKGSLFLAQAGISVDGHQFIEQAISSGAVAVLCEQLPETLIPGIGYVQVKEVAVLSGLVAATFFDFPSREMKVIGVTGTNGKTTVATLLYQTFQALGHKSGLLSTVQNQIAETVIPSTHTTPDPVSIQALLRQMADEGCSHVFMEVSSHAIHQHRIGGIEFSGGIFTNITHDHLDYHKTFDEYIRVKKQFFDHLPDTAFALTNADDKRGMVMLQNTKARRKAYSLRIPSDYKGKVLENDLDGLHMNLNRHEVHFRLSGLFNAYNLLAVYGASELLGADGVAVLALLSNMRGASGRFATYRSPKEKMLAVIDYAHTPDALLNVLATIKQFGGHRQIITVVGCGGDRDRTKRPIMAKVAVEHSNKVILTSDNPRNEDPEEILNEMEAGIGFGQRRKAIRITDRREAIKTACMLAQQDDVLLIAGKGHETYQEVKGVKYHFDDKEVLEEMFGLLDK